MTQVEYQYDFLAGGGQLGALIRTKDWAATPLGPIETWPQSLRTLVNTSLNCSFPILVGWGPKLVHIYNDAYAEIIAAKHPHALGSVARDVWPEIWDTIGPILGRVMDEGKAFPADDLRLDLHRKGYPEECYFSFSYSPIRDETGRIAGVFCPVVETTERVFAERRAAFLLDLENRLRVAPTASAALDVACEAIGRALGGVLCTFNDLDADNLHVEVTSEWRSAGTPSVLGRHSLADCGENRLPDLLSGAPELVEDILADPRTAGTPAEAAYASLGCRASLTVPYYRDGRVHAMLAIAAAAPRRWAEHEVTLALWTIDRTWPAVERARAETAQQQAEGDYRALFIGTPTPFLLLSPDPARFTIIDVNEAYLAGSMTTREGLVGRDLFDAFPDNPTDAKASGVATLRASLERALSSKKTDALSRLKYEIRRPDGVFEERFWDPVNTPLLDADGEVVALLHHATDITDALRTEAALAASEAAEKRAGAELRYRAQQFETLIDQAPVGVYLIDGDFRIAQVNPLAQPVFGDIPDLVGRDFDEVIHILWETSYADEVCQLFRHALETGEPYETPERAQFRADRGLVEYYSWRINRITLPDGRYGVVCYFSDVSEQVRARLAITESEKKYRTLFETMGQGFAFCEIIRDAKGNAIDHRLIEINPAFEQITGIPVAQGIGRTMIELLGRIEAEWLAAFDRVVRTGEGETVEKLDESLDRWIGADVYSAGGDRFIALYDNITQRKRAEAVLRESEERQAFMLELSDALRPLSDPIEIQRTAMDHVVAHFGVESAVYVEFGPDGDSATIREGHRSTRIPFPPVVRLSDFGQAFFDDLNAGRNIPYEDVEVDPRLAPDRDVYRALNIRSGAGIPLMKDGRLIAGLAVNHTEPRRWPQADLRLLEELGERTWAAVERARAEASLRESEERLRQFGDASQDVLRIRDAQTLQWVYLTPAFETIYGLSRDEALTGENFSNWQSLILPEDRDATIAAISRVQAGENATFEYRIRRPADGAVRWLRDTDFPIFDDAGKTVMIGGVGHDFTDVREAELRLQTLVEGMPQLVWRAVEAGQWTWASPQWTDYTGQVEAEYIKWGWITALHPDDVAIAREAWSHALENGGFEVEYRLRRQADAVYRWFQTRAVAVRDRAGRIIEWLGTSTDIHDLRELQERQEVLVAELQHRTRNLIGVVRSTADKTARTSIDVADFRARFRDRLDALARVQGLLSRLNDHDRVTFDDLINTELAAMNGNAERATVHGPSGIRLRSSTVQTLAMALHELATNAVKYGALGQANGQLSITWTVGPLGDDRGPWLHIDWLETGVVMPKLGAAAQGSGQGRELIERALPYQLSARTTYVLGPDGVHCTISVPISVNTGDDGSVDV